MAETRKLQTIAAAGFVIALCSLLLYARTSADEPPEPMHNELLDLRDSAYHYLVVYQSSNGSMVGLIAFDPEDGANPVIAEGQSTLDVTEDPSLDAFLTDASEGAIHHWHVDLMELELVQDE